MTNVEVLAGISASESKKMVFECPIHGTREYLTFRRRDGQWPEPYCPICVKERKEREAKIAEVTEDASRQARSISKMLGLKEVPGWDRWTFDSYEISCPSQKRAFEICKRFADGFLDREIKRHEARHACNPDWHDVNHWGLALQGNPGTGKTHMCAAIAKVLADAKVPAVYLRVMDLFMALKDRERRIDEPTLFRQLAVVPCLILDEFGRHTWTDFDKTRLWQLIDDRLNFGRPTIVVTNLNRSELASVVDETILDRFKDSLFPVMFDWESHRGTKEITFEEVF